MAIETELKLRFLVPEAAAKLPAHPLLADAGAGTVERLVATYYDTPDRELLDLGVAMRVRREGGRLLQTIKTAKTVFGGLHQRNEWETELREDHAPDFHRLTDALGGKTLGDDLLGRIGPCFTTDFQRAKWILPLLDDHAGEGYAEKGYIEVCLDQGRIHSGEHTAPLHEVELELKCGDDAAHLAVHLYEMALRLQETLPLVIENASKAQRGYELGGYGPGRSSLPAPHPPQPVALAPEMPARSALIAMVQNGYAQVEANEAAVLCPGADPAGVRWMRAGARRMCSCLTLLEPMISPDDSRSLRAELDWIAHLLDRAREWDIFAQTLDRIGENGTAEKTGAEASQSLRTELNKRRDRHYRELREALVSVRYSRLLLHLGAWLSKES